MFDFSKAELNGLFLSIPDICQNCSEKPIGLHCQAHLKKHLNEYQGKDAYVKKEKAPSNATVEQKKAVAKNNKITTDKLKVLNRLVKSAPNEIIKNEVKKRYLTLKDDENIGK